MFRFFLYKFFKVLSKPYKTLDKEMFKKYVSEEKLIDEILIIKEFKHLWREKLGNTVLKEKLKKSKKKMRLN